MVDKSDIARALQTSAAIWGDRVAFDDAKRERLREILAGHCPPENAERLIDRARFAHIGILATQARDGAGDIVRRASARDKLTRVAELAAELREEWRGLGDDLRAKVEIEARPFLKPVVTGDPWLSLRRELPTLLAALDDTAKEIAHTLDALRVDKPAEYEFARALAAAWREETGDKPTRTGNRDNATDKKFHTPFQRFVVEAAFPYTIKDGVMSDAISAVG